MSDPQKTRVKRIPVWKQILFTVLISIGFFVSIEIVLAVAGIKPYTSLNDPFVGFSDFQPLFVEQTQPDGSVIMTTAKNKTDFFNVQNFPKKKGPNTFRIFCLGGSTTYGRPYDDRMSFSGWLRAFLPVANPSHHWEVINCGGISYASYRVAGLMKELGQYEPDLFIIYSGNNEFLEKRTYQALQELPRFLVYATEILASTRIYSVMKDVYDRSLSQSSDQKAEKYQLPGEVDEILDHSVGPAAYTRDNIQKNNVIAHYQFNLELMVGAARSVGSEIMFVSPAVNLKDISPFKSQNDEGLSEAERSNWGNLYNSGNNLLQSGEYREALSAFQQALAIDSRYADLDYRSGQALFKLERFDEAKESFQRAVDEDICPLRILTPMGQALRSVTEKKGVPLVDFRATLEKLYARDYGHTISGAEYFLDHVHLTYQGYRLLALTLLDELVRQGTVEPIPAWNDAAIAAVTKKMEEQLDSKMIARSLFNLANVMDWAGKLEEAYSLYLKSYEMFQNNETLSRLGYNSSRRGNIPQSIEYLQKVLQTDLNNPLAHYGMATNFELQGRFAEALGHREKMVEIAPDDPDAHYRLGLCLKKLNKYDSALYHLQEAVRIAPESITMRRSLAVLYSAAGKIDESVEEYTNILKMNPDLVEVNNDLGAVLMNMKGETVRAELYFRKTLQLDPNSFPAAFNLAMSLQKQGKIQEAIIHYKKAISINPQLVVAYESLGTILEQQGRGREAESYFSEAKRILKNANQN